MRSRAGVLLAVTASAVLAAIAFSRGGGERPESPLALRAASGALEVHNSRSGQAIFSAGMLAPGKSAGGSVWISNESSRPAGIVLDQRLRDDAPGSLGASLRKAIDLAIREGRGSSARTVFRGPPGAMGPLRLKNLKAGQERRYAFTVTLPAAAADAYQGAGLTLDYEWTLSTVGAGRSSCSRGRLGTGLPDQLVGTRRGDRLRAGAGADSVFGRGGRDCLLGGEGRDLLAGGRGADRINGGGDADELRGGPGDDRLVDGPGVDAASGGGGDDLVLSADGDADLIACGPGLDIAVVDDLDRTRGCEQTPGAP